LQVSGTFFFLDFLILCVPAQGYRGRPPRHSLIFPFLFPRGMGYLGFFNCCQAAPWNPPKPRRWFPRGCLCLIPVMSSISGSVFVPQLTFFRSDCRALIDLFHEILPSERKTAPLWLFHPYPFRLSRPDFINVCAPRSYAYDIASSQVFQTTGVPPGLKC